MTTEITKEQREAFLKEYEIGEQLRNSYFTNSWVSTSIILPISFGLIGFSFSSQELLGLEWFKLIPLMLASVFLYIFWLWYVTRYGDVMKSIYERLWYIEETLGMSLHSCIREKDKTRKLYRFRTIRVLNLLMLLLLVLAWCSRLYFAPLVVP